MDFLEDVVADLIKEVEIGNGFKDKYKFLDRILDIISERYRVEACSIFLETDEQGKYKCVAGKGYAKDINNIAYYKIDENFTGFVLRQMRPYRIENKERLDIIKKVNNIPSIGKYDDIMWDQSRDRVFKNLIIIPLIIDNHAIGVLKAENKMNNEDFSDEEFKSLKLTGGLLSLAISNIQLYEKYEKSKKYNEIIDMLPRLLSSKQKNEILENLMKQTMDFFDAEVCFIFLRNPMKPNFLHCVAGAGYAKEVVQSNVEYELGKSDGLTGTIADGKFSVLINSESELSDYRNKGIAVSRADQYLEKRGLFRNMIGAPLLKINENNIEEIVGVIKVENKKFNESFTVYDKMMLETIAKIAAISIDSIEESTNSIPTSTKKNKNDLSILLSNARIENENNNHSLSIDYALSVAQTIKNDDVIKKLNICLKKFDQLEMIKNNGQIDFTSKLALSNSITASIEEALDELEKSLPQ